MQEIGQAFSKSHFRIARFTLFGLKTVGLRHKRSQRGTRAPPPIKIPPMVKNYDNQA